MIGRYKIEEEYDLSNPLRQRFSVHDIAGEIIHSFALVWATNKQDNVDGAFVCSYKNQDKRALFISLRTFCDLINHIVDDEVTSHRMEKNLATGKIYRVIDWGLRLGPRVV